MCSPHSLASTVGGDETSPPCLRASTGTDHTTSERARTHTHANARAYTRTRTYAHARKSLGTQCQRRFQATGSVIVFLMNIIFEWNYELPVFVTIILEIFTFLGKIAPAIKAVIEIITIIFVFLVYSQNNLMCFYQFRPISYFDDTINLNDVL